MKLQVIMEALEAVNWIESAFRAYKLYLFGSAKYGVLCLYPDRKTFRLYTEDKTIMQKTVSILYRLGFTQE